MNLRPPLYRVCRVKAFGLISSLPKYRVSGLNLPPSQCQSFKGLILTTYDFANYHSKGK